MAFLLFFLQVAYFSVLYRKDDGLCEENGESAMGALPKPNVTAKPGYIFDKWDVEDTATVTGSLTAHALYTETPFDAAAITRIEVTQQPTLRYPEGKAIDLGDLRARLTDANGKTVEISYSDLADYGITASPDHGTATTAALNGTPIRLTKGSVTGETDPLTVTPTAQPNVIGPVDPSTPSKQANQTNSSNPGPLPQTGERLPGPYVALLLLFLALLALVFLLRRKKRDK